MPLDCASQPQEPAGTAGPITATVTAATPTTIGPFARTATRLRARVLAWALLPGALLPGVPLGTSVGPSLNLSLGVSLVFLGANPGAHAAAPEARPPAPRASLPPVAPLVQAPPPAPLPAPRDEPWPGPLQLRVDATDLARRVLQVQLTLPVEQPGQRLTLLYPRFLPGAHGPFGRVEQLAGLRIQDDQGRPLPWQRDALDTHAFHVDVPEGVQALQLRYQHLSPTHGGGDRVAIGRQQLGIAWETVLLYPAGRHVSALRVQPRLRLPAGWQQASALADAQGQRPAAPGTDGWLAFREVSLETLVDSPLFAGAHLQRIALDGPGEPRPVVLNLLADRADQLAHQPAQIDAHRRLVQQAERLFGSRPWGRYDFLLALSDQVGGLGLEHHESSENVLRPDYFSRDWAQAIRGRELLAHEFVHAWNGKLHRPDDLWTASYNVPMRNSLLWVYEGLTEYWGHVLAARAGLSTPEQARDRLAQHAGYYAEQPGRAWRPLRDTTHDPRLGPGDQRDWVDWQRDADYYTEGLLLWLDVDTWIRERSQGKRSLDDLAAQFFGPLPPRRPDGSARPALYGFEALVQALHRIEPHDWAQFLNERLDRSGPGSAPLGGVERSGWTLQWQADEGPFQPNERGWSGSSGTERPADFGFSLGLYLLADGSVDQVVWGSPAFEAGILAGQQVLAVAGLAYTPERLRQALLANRDGRQPVALLVKDDEHYRHLLLDERRGPRHPVLVRRGQGTDWLSQIYTARPAAR